MPPWPFGSKRPYREAQMAELPCPFNEGQHKKLVWQGDGRSGFSCRYCHKTWEWRGPELVETYAARHVSQGGGE